MAAWLRVSTLNSVDLPTFGRPTIATIGSMGARPYLPGSAAPTAAAATAPPPTSPARGAAAAQGGAVRAQPAVVGECQPQPARHQRRTADALFVGDALGGDDRV